MPEAPDWDRDGRDWPNREASRFVRAAGIRWHVQTMGQGPVLLLVHGTGAATHSWRALAPLLARDFTVIAPDLPGHGFTGALPDADMSLRGMSQALRALLVELGAKPALVAGHSSGAAVLARMCIDGGIQPECMVSLNGALLPFRGLAGQFFLPIAKLLATTALVPRLFAWRASDERAVERLLAGTGSRIDPQGARFYARLLGNRAHVGNVLRMMSNWDLSVLERDLPKLGTVLVLVVGANDLTVPPAQARSVAALLPRARIETLAALGHLAHEEAPERIAEILRQHAA